VLRSDVKIENLIIPKGIIMPLTGIIPFKITERTTILLEMNESSPFCVVYWNDSSKFEFTPIFTELIKEFNSFLDIGANLGFYSFLAAKSNPDITVHAFEILDDATSKSLEKLILPLDYKMFQYTDRGLLPLDVITFGDNEKERNFFFVPKSKLDLIQHFTIK
jgi:hypothetical protein